VFINVVADAVK